MKILSRHREHVRDRVFPLRISVRERKKLTEESIKTKKSIAELIRRGFLCQNALFP